MQHVADYPPVLGRPQVGAGVEQSLARGLQAHRCAFAALGQRLPQEAELDPGGGRALGELLVDRIDLPLGCLQEPLDLGGDLGLEVVFEQSALARGQELAALGDHCSQSGGELVGVLRTVLVNDADDHAVVTGVGLGLLTERGQRAPEFAVVVGDLALDARPGLVVVGHLRQGLLGAAGQRERRLDRPRRTQIG